MPNQPSSRSSDRAKSSLKLTKQLVLILQPPLSQLLHSSLPNQTLTGAIAKKLNSQASEQESKPLTPYWHPLTNSPQFHLPQMFLNHQSASPIAAHATKLRANKESMPRESDISASMEISKLLKILSSMNFQELKKPPRDLETRHPAAFLTTRVHKNSVASVFQVSTHAPIKAESVQEPQATCDYQLEGEILSL
jgi:hypothetical protein